MPGSAAGSGYPWTLVGMADFRWTLYIKSIITNEFYILNYAIKKNGHGVKTPGKNCAQQKFVCVKRIEYRHLFQNQA